MVPYLIPELQSRYNTLHILKKGSSYFSISCDDLLFKDALLFSSPTNLTGYLKQNGVTECKSIWPYSFFNSVQQLNQQVVFPPYEAFYSELRQSNVLKKDYEEAHAEFTRRLGLPDTDKEKMSNFRDWLTYYNLLDTVPLAKAVNNSFETFFNVFGIDPSTCLSLPKYAQLCVFKSYSKNAPFCYSFAKKMDDIRLLFRNNVLGGLVNVYSRYTELNKDEPNVPNAARFAPNGEPFTKISFFDFNALYLWSQAQEFPTTPGERTIIFCETLNICALGILWELSSNKKYFRKKTMSYNNSLGAIQWLMFQQSVCSDLVDSKANRVKLEHQYYRGEFKFHDYLIDGYANVDGVHVFFEFLGCYYLELSTMFTNFNGG